MHRLLVLLSCLIVVQSLTPSPLVWERRRDFSQGGDLLSSLATVGDTAIVDGASVVPGGPNLEVLS
jgi:hypothetical protein